MVCHFVANQENPFYQSDNFMRMIRYAGDHPKRVHLKETPDRLSMVFDNVTSIGKAIDVLKEMSA